MVARWINADAGDLEDGVVVEIVFKTRLAGDRRATVRSVHHRGGLLSKIGGRQDVAIHDVKLGDVQAGHTKGPGPPPPKGRRATRADVSWPPDQAALPRHAEEWH